jgi:ribonuclease P protein subunit RPR2
VTPPASTPARAPRRPCEYPWTERGAGIRALLPLPAAPAAGPADDLDAETGQPSWDLLTVQEWALAANSSRDLPELVARLGASVARLGACRLVVYPWDRLAGALAPAPGHWGSAEPVPLAALRRSPLSAAIVAAGCLWTVPNLSQVEAAADYAPAWALGWRALAGLPLAAQGEPAGLLYVAWDAPHALPARERTLLELLGQHVAISLSNASVLAESRARAEALERAEQQTVNFARDLRRVYERERARRAEVQAAYLTTVKVLAAAIETRDAYTGGHVERVAEYSVKIGHELGWDEDQLMTLELGALLHDIGKIGVDDGVLRKPAKLDPDEWEHMQRHPELGAHMLRDVPFLQQSLSCVLYHHERYDGRGYPYRLTGEAIPLEARIVSVADTYDAMTSDRPYRKGLDGSVALEEIARCAGTQFDPLVVQAFLRVVDARPIISLPSD